jgi:hypothetical protein
MSGSVQRFLKNTTPKIAAEPAGPREERLTGRGLGRGRRFPFSAPAGIIQYATIHDADTAPDAACPACRFQEG